MRLKQWCEDNGYSLLDTLPSNWDRYQDWLPSVTTILKLIQDPWFEYVKRNHAGALETARIRWTITHKESEDFFNWESDTVHKQIMKFHTLYDVTIIGQEVNFKKDIQWTIDLMAHIGSIIDTDMNIDYKPKTKSKKYFIQWWWYEYLNWLKSGILYLDKNDYKFEVVTTWYLELFIELKDYFLTLLNNDNRDI